jgi:hypothetical protein
VARPTNPAQARPSWLLRALKRLPTDMLRRAPDRQGVAARLLWRALMRLSSRERFELVHARSLWGSAESVSGTGSTWAETAVLRSRLPALLRRLAVRTLLDVPCGDFNWLQHVDLGSIRYVGLDVVAPLIEQNRLRYAAPGREFHVGDLLVDALPAADAALVRDCLVHLSFEEGRRALGRLQTSGIRYLLLTTFPATDVNEDIPSGLWRPLNMERPPFGLPPPDLLLHEGHPDVRYASKSLGLWDLHGGAATSGAALRAGGVAMVDHGERARSGPAR